MAKIARPTGTRPAKQMGQVWVLETEPVMDSSRVRVLCILDPNPTRIYKFIKKKTLKTLTINTNNPNPNPHFSFSIIHSQVSATFLSLRLSLGVHKGMEWNGMIIREWKIMYLSKGKE